MVKLWTVQIMARVGYARAMAVRGDYSVGGIVTDESQRVVLIRTRSLAGRAVWGLPKGHPDPNETPVQAAVREVTEETGLRVEVIDEEPVASVQYWFVDHAGHRINKRVEYFRMRMLGGDPANHDHEVEEVAFLTAAAAARRLTYQNERDALAAALKAGLPHSG